MHSKFFNNRSVALCLTLALLAVAAQVLLPVARAQEQMGQLTVVGKVKVNGQPAATGDVFASGGTIETAKGSSAVVSLGKLGRVEVLPETRMKLSYDSTTYSIMVESGSARFTTGEGVTATVKAKE